jgi:hypothetical protein
MIEKVIKELDSAFGEGWSEKNEALVIEYYKATQIGRISWALIEAGNNLGIALNEGVAKELSEISKNIQALDVLKVSDEQVL